MVSSLPGWLGAATLTAAASWVALQVLVGALQTQVDALGARGLMAVDATATLLWMAQLTAWVLTGAWLTQALSVVRGRGGYEQHGVAMAWVGWFLPVVQLVVPYEVMSDATKPMGRARDGVLRTWWAAWMVAWGLILVSYVVLARSGHGGAAPWSLAAGAALAAALVPFARLVLGTTRAVARPVTP